MNACLIPPNIRLIMSRSRETTYRFRPISIFIYLIITLLRCNGWMNLLKELPGIKMTVVLMFPNVDFVVLTG